MLKYPKLAKKNLKPNLRYCSFYPLVIQQITKIIATKCNKKFQNKWDKSLLNIILIKNLAKNMNIEKLKNYKHKKYKQKKKNWVP
jgi:hypothetical protein